MKSDNKNVYESSELAQRYSREEKLQPPEASILTSIKLRLNGSRMLDIGVGGGRTTLHFAPLVGSYAGIDYSEQMIAACKERFGEIPNLLTFQMADVRSCHRSQTMILISYSSATTDWITFRTIRGRMRCVRFAGFSKKMGVSRSQPTISIVCNSGSASGLFCGPERLPQSCCGHAAFFGTIGRYTGLERPGIAKFMTGRWPIGCERTTVLPNSRCRS